MVIHSKIICNVISNVCRYSIGIMDNGAIYITLTPWFSLEITPSLRSHSLLTFKHTLLALNCTNKTRRGVTKTKILSFSNRFLQNWYVWKAKSKACRSVYVSCMSKDYSCLHITAVMFPVCAGYLESGVVPSFSCGCILVDKNIALTAAHCADSGNV